MAAEIDAIRARMTELERAMVEVSHAQRSARWVLPIAVSVFVAGAGVLGALNVYAIARIDTVSDRVSDTRDQATKTGADVTVLTGRFDALEKTVAQIDGTVQGMSADVQTLGGKVDFLTATTTMIARTVGIAEKDLPLPLDPDKPR